MKELLQNVHEMDSNVSERLENADQISFDMDEMFSPLAIDPEKLSEKEKTRYEELNKRYENLVILINTHEYLWRDMGDTRGSRGERFIWIKNPENGRVSGLYPYEDWGGYKTPSVPELVILDYEERKVTKKLQLTAKDYENVLKKMEEMFNNLNERYHRGDFQDTMPNEDGRKWPEDRPIVGEPKKPGNGKGNQRELKHY